MSDTYECPAGAQKLLNLIRQTAPRPLELPVIVGGWQSGRSLRWQNPSYRSVHDFPGGIIQIVSKHTPECCPMGLLPRAIIDLPDKAFHLNQHSDQEIVYDHEVAAFAEWWDSLEDPQKAVDAVWGKK